MITLKFGDRGDEVRTLQRLLHITDDGVFGPMTDAAVKKFQREHGLTDDGIVGAMTWSALGVVDSKSVDPSVIYAPLKSCITRYNNRKIKYLAIHYTAGASSAEGRAISMKNGWESSKRASADFGVDDRDMVQFNPDPRNYYCWAVGDKKAARVNCPDGNNKNTISIEICSTLRKGTSAAKPNHEGWSYTDAARDNGIKLAKILMKRYDIPIERVVRHFDISGKLCPGIIGWNDGKIYTTEGIRTTRDNNSREWYEFKKRLNT